MNIVQAKPYSYTLQNARRFTDHVFHNQHSKDCEHFSEESLDAAVRDAFAQHEERGITGRIHVFIPTIPWYMSAGRFRAYIEDIWGSTCGPVKPVSDPSIFGRFLNAISARGFKNESFSEFLVYDPQAQLFVDFVDRSSASRVEPAVRQKYLDDISAQYGTRVGWTPTIVEAEPVTHP